QSNPKYNGNVKWNFTKFLIDKNGQVVDRFSPVTKPLSKKVVDRITKLIK
ncbi:glutathione peroxidase, partial [bacterium]|nr:glutathione peroxidase [bacterium]